MLDFLKDNLRLSHIAFILALLTPAAALLFVPSLARWGRRWLVAVLVFYAVVSSPAGAGLLSRTLRDGYRPLQSVDEARGAQAIVLLGSGSVNLRAAGRQLSAVTIDAGLRVIETARLFDLLKGPAASGATSGSPGSVEGPLVVASGGVTEQDDAAAPESVALQRALIDLGVPADRIVLESESKNTHDEAMIIKRMLAERGVTRFVLVTSPLHMRRSLLAFEQQGMQPIPSASALVPDRSRPRSVLLPGDMWLSVSDGVIYEWLARGYYWWQGWLG